MSKKRILSFLLAIIMVATNFTPVFANNTGGSIKTGPKELNVKTVEDSRGNKKNSIEISRLGGTKKRSKRSLSWFGLGSAQTVSGQSGTSSAQEMWDAEVNLNIKKLGIGGESFDWD